MITNRLVDDEKEEPGKIPAYMIVYFYVAGNKRRRTTNSNKKLPGLMQCSLSKNENDIVFLFVLSVYNCFFANLN